MEFYGPRSKFLISYVMLQEIVKLHLARMKHQSQVTWICSKYKNSETNCRLDLYL